ncbi:hypothetical protein [Ruthenibacterium lactatiformans]|uniref:hypothetical protein n=1 Tax=Ruthenibacterium lactatiformans TaxID=1550024 RepID=UPI002494098C|nr:hypothetical protein [Ruthenibacterium lactatiformans]
MKKRIVAWLLIMTMVLGLAGCGAASAGSTAGSEGGSTAQEGSAAKTITLYPYNAGLQSGPVTGWLGDYLLEKGIILEVIPYSEEKTQAMLASGSLPDIVVFNSATNAKAALEAGMLLPLDDYQDQLPHVMENDILKAGLDYAREYYGTEDGELSILPFGVGKNTLYAAADTDRYAIKLNYQLYEQIGAPEFEKLEDVIPILKEMQQAYPQNEEGMNVYAMNLFSDFDTTHFFNMMSIYSILGYHWNYLPYGIEYEIETGTPYSIFREDSVYRRGARFMYELNQQGLLDPDSLTQERATADKKVSSKASVAGWAGVPGWAGKGYLPVPFDEFKPSLVTEEPYGKVGIAISANAENVDTCLKFVDMLADYDALLTLYNGPQGDRWDIKDGKLVMTDKFKEYLEAGGGTYVLKNGEEYSLFNIVSYIPNMGNTIEKYGEPFPMTLWTEYVDRQYETEDAQAWSARYGYKYLKDLLEAENKMTAVMDTSFVPFLTPDSDDMKLTLAALKDVIVPSTWELIYAKDDAEFEQIWSRMKQNAEALGLEDVISYKVEDIAQAKETAKQFK